MRLPPRPALLVLFVSMMATTNAISLSNFSPKITTTLSSACSTVYNEQIPGCTAADFTSNAQCSSSCLQGLVQINSLVQSSCQNDDVSETSIIGLFKQGQGIQVLCDVAVVTTTTGVATKSTSSSASQSIGQSTMLLSSMVASSKSIMTDTSMPTAPPPPSASSPMTTVPVVTSASTSKSSTSSSSTSSSTKTSSSAQADNGGNDQSGGGSPFDNPNNSLGTPGFTLSSTTALLSIALGIILLLR